MMELIRRMALTLIIMRLNSRWTPKSRLMAPRHLTASWFVKLKCCYHWFIVILQYYNWV